MFKRLYEYFTFWIEPECNSGVEKAVFVERTRLLLDQISIITRASIIVPSVVVLVLWQHIDHTAISLWLFTIIMVSLARYRLFNNLSGKVKTYDQATQATRRYILWGFIGSLNWSIGGLLLFVSGDPELIAFVTLIVLGSTLAATSTLAASPVTFLVFSLPVFLTVIFRIAVEGGTFYLAFSASIAFLFMILYSTLQTAYKSLINSIRLNFSNLTLVEELRIKRDLAEANQEKADTANEAKSDFIARTSHDIRTPLNGILGIASLLLQSDLSKKQRQQAETIKGAGLALQELLNDVLDISKMEAGKITIAKSEFSPSELCNELENLWIAKAAEKGLSFESAIAPDLGDVMIGDRGRICQILSNFLSNAIKFTDSGGINLFITLIEDGNQNAQVRFCVSDTGCGIGPEDRTRLFEAYEQVGDEQDNQVTGSGLGLAIAKELAELMSGQIGFESEPGLGTLFWISLPLERPKTRNVKKFVCVAAETPAAICAFKTPLNILVVEDNQINQQVLSGLLESMEQLAHICDNGPDAIDAVANGNFDLVLMDVQMPGMSGIDAAREIRKLKGPAGELPIIAVTANSMEGDRENCLAAGMTDFLTKPIDVSLLEKAIINAQKHNN
jgi:two-component system, sensor histidine kinase